MGKKNVVAAALILILQFSVSMHLTAQDLKSQTGIYFGYNLLNQVSNFKTLPGLQSCCENFTGGGGYGLSAGALHRMFFSKFFGIGLRLGYNQMDGTMTKQEFIGNAYDSDFNTVEAISEYTLETYLRSVEVMPLVFIRPFDMPLTLNAGLSVGYTFSGTDNHTEELVDPVGAQFINGSKYRKSSNDIGDIFQPSVYIRPGVTYDIKISGSLILSPEIWAGFPIFNTVKNTDWKTSTIGLTAALKYVVPDKEPEPPAEPPLPPMPEPPPPPEAPPIGATVEAYAFNNEVGETNLKGIIIQEYLSKRIYPLLNYIFFDDNSAAIPARYVKMPESGTKSFSADKFFGESTLDVYYEILNIIGYRMRRNPGATLTVTGCNSNTGDEAGDLKLSRSRAETIKDYLTKTWGIKDSRIKVFARGLPESPSNPESPDGIEENRRVELSSVNDDIFEPLTINDTVFKSIPPTMRFKIKMTSNAVVSKWKLTTWQSGREMKVFSGKGKIPAILDWEIESERDIIPRFEKPLVYRLKIWDDQGNEWESPAKQLQVETITAKDKYIALMKGEETNEKELNEFGLMSFGFNQAKLNDEHLNILELARKSIKPGSKVIITGYTDRMGDEQHNQELSKERAVETAKALGVDTGNAKGVGESNPLFTNDLPEGRFYNRSVHILVETKVNEK